MILLGVEDDGRIAELTRSREAAEEWVMNIARENLQPAIIPLWSSVAMDEEGEIQPTMKNLVKKEFDRGRTVPVIYFPSDGGEVQDSPKLTLVVMEPGTVWGGERGLRDQVAEWTRQRGQFPRLYPGSLVWCLASGQSAAEFSEWFPYPVVGSGCCSSE